MWSIKSTESKSGCATSSLQSICRVFTQIMDNSDHRRFYSSSSQRFIACRLPLWTSQSWTSHAVLDWTCPLGWNLFQSDPCLSSDPATQATLQSLGCFSWLSSTIIYASSFVCSILSSQDPFAPAIAPADRGRHWLQRTLWTDPPCGTTRFTFPTKKKHGPA